MIEVELIQEIYTFYQEKTKMQNLPINWEGWKTGNVNGENR